jgi:hypothetical protein
MDMVAWYSTAWFDRYVKCQGDQSCKQSADRRLLTNRWRKDSEEGAVDPNGDPNMYSFYYRSRYDFHVPGAGEVTCDDMRAGCPTMAPDNQPPNYDYFKDATTPDGR